MRLQTSVTTLRTATPPHAPLGESQAAYPSSIPRKVSILVNGRALSRAQAIVQDGKSKVLIFPLITREVGQGREPKGAHATAGPGVTRPGSPEGAKRPTPGEVGEQNPAAQFMTRSKIWPTGF